MSDIPIKKVYYIYVINKTYNAYMHISFTYIPCMLHFILFLIQKTYHYLHFNINMYY